MDMMYTSYGYDEVQGSHRLIATVAIERVTYEWGGIV